MVFTLKRNYELPHIVKYSQYILLVLLITILASMLVSIGYAEGQLQDALNSSAFRGVFSTLTKATWLWIGVQWIVSWACGLGLAISVVNFFLIISYKCCQNIFDQVAIIKQDKMRGKFFGIPEFAKALMNPDGSIGWGGGLDTFIAAGLSLLPNVKGIVMGLNRGGEKGDIIKEEHSMMQTTIRAVQMFFLNILILSLGFNGTALKGVAMGVDAISVTLDHYMEYDVKTAVERKLTAIGGHTFTFSQFQTEAGDLAQDVAIKINSAILSRVQGEYNKDFVRGLGDIVEKSVYGTFDGTAGGSITKSFLGADKYGYETLTILANAGNGEDISYREVNSEAAVRDLKVDVVLSQTPLPIGDTGMSFDLGKMINQVSSGAGTDSAKYAHVFVSFSRTSTADFILDGNDGKSNKINVELGNQLNK